MTISPPVLSYTFGRSAFSRLLGDLDDDFLALTQQVAN